jgi:hypothetical protein
MERWQTNIEDWTKLTEQSAQFYINQAESRLKSTEDTANILTTSNDRLLGITTSLVSVSIGYLFAGNQIYLQAVSFFVLLVCLIAGFYLIQNMSKYEIYTVGEEPKIIFNSPFIDNSYTKSQQYLNLVFQMMETIQMKIDKNHLINFVRQARLDKAKKVLLTIPLAFALAAVYLHLLGYHLVWVL